MPEIEKTSDTELKTIAGGKVDTKQEAKLDLPRVVDPGSLDMWPTVEYTCPDCGCKYKHRHPGGPGMGKSATFPKCPKCGK